MSEMQWHGHKSASDSIAGVHESTFAARHRQRHLIWTEYEMSVTFHGQVIKHRGTAIYQKTGQKWVMSNMNYAAAQPDK